MDDNKGTIMGELEIKLYILTRNYCPKNTRIAFKKGTFIIGYVGSNGNLVGHVVKNFNNYEFEKGSFKENNANN